MPLTCILPLCIVASCTHGLKSFRKLQVLGCVQVHRLHHTCCLDFPQHLPWMTMGPTAAGLKSLPNMLWDRVSSTGWVERQLVRAQHHGNWLAATSDSTCHPSPDGVDTRWQPARTRCGWARRLPPWLPGTFGSIEHYSNICTCMHDHMNGKV